jgi:hypothetical protein
VLIQERTFPAISEAEGDDSVGEERADNAWGDGANGLTGLAVALLERMASRREMYRTVFGEGIGEFPSLWMVRLGGVL